MMTWGWLRWGPLLSAVALAWAATGCGGDDGAAPTSTTTVPASLDDLASVLPEPVAPSVAGLRDLADELDRYCGEPAEWLAILRTVPAAIDELRILVEALPSTELREFRDEWGAGLGMVMADRFVAQAGCSTAPIDGAVPVAEDALLQATGEATAAVDDLHLVLEPRTFSPRSLHFTKDELASAGWLLDVDPAAEGWTLVLGSSQARLGVDPALLSDRLSRRFGLAALDGAFPEIQVPWLAEIDRVARPDELVIVVSALDLFGLCEVAESAGQYEQILARRAGAYPLAWFPPVDTWSRLLGPETGRSYDGGLTALASASVDAGTFGRAVNEDEWNQEQYDIQLAVNGPSFRNGARCDERLDILTEWVADEMAAGRPVTVVVIPTAPDLLELHPEGVDGISAGVADMGRRVEAAGGVYVDLSDEADAGDLRDATHLNERGRVRFTTALAVALGDDG